MGTLKKLSLFFTLTLIFSSLFACKDDEPDDASNLSLSSTQLTLMSDKGSTTSFNITCGGSWSAICDSDWLILSSKGGNGNASITLTALTENATATPRVANIEIVCGGNTATVEVTQLAALQSNCNVNITNFLSLDTSIAFDFVPDAKVDYFVFGWLSASSSAGYTNDRIINILENGDFDNLSAGDLLTGYAIGELDPDSEYYLCTIAYDSKGNRGELVKQSVKTKKSKNTDPYVSIYNFKRTSTDFEWETAPDGYTSKYYMSVWTGDVAIDAAFAYPANLAYLIRNYIAADKLSVISRGGAWRLAHGGEYFITVSTWAVDAENQFSARFNTALWYPDYLYSIKPKEQTQKPKNNINHLTPEFIELAKENLKVYIVE